MTSPIKTKTILVFRSAYWPVFRNALSLIRRDYPEARITLLVQKQYCAAVASEFPDLEIISYEPAAFTIVLAGYRWLREIRNRKFDLAIIPYNPYSRYSYLHVELLALLAGTKIVRGYDYFAARFRITGMSWFGKLLLLILQVPLVLLIALVVTAVTKLILLKRLIPARKGERGHD